MDAIAEKTAATGVTIDGVLLKDSLTVSDIVTISGTDTITGAKAFTHAQVYFTHATAPPAITSQPTNNTHAANKLYVDQAVLAASGNYVESVNLVSVMPELGAVIPGVSYKDIGSAIASFASPAETNQCCVLVKGTGITSQYIQVNVSALKDYVHIRGIHRKINIVPDIAVETTTDQNMMFENCSVFLGANTITTARTLANMQLINCDIYFYNDLTLDGANLKVKNCTFYSASGHDVTYTGAGEITDCHFMQTANASSFTGVYSGNYDNDNNSYTPPTDPSPSP